MTSQEKLDAVNALHGEALRRAEGDVQVALSILAHEAYDAGVRASTGPVPETREGLQAALRAVDADIARAAGALYDRRRTLRDALAERFPADLPDRRGRTKVQEEVAACPRCGGSLEELDRAIEIAERLFQMVPEETWRDAGGDDGQGHYEGEARAAAIREELEAMRRRTP